MKYQPPEKAENIPEFLRGLSENAMLVRIKIGTWSPTKIDKRAQTTVAVHHGINEKAGIYRKRLLDCAEVKTLQKSASALRSTHWEKTARFGDSEGRLLAVKEYENYARDMDALIADYDKSRESFLKVYSKRIAEAKEVLGDLWDPADYPSEEKVRDQIRAEYVIDNIRTADHFVAKVTHKAAQDIQKQINDRTVSQWTDSYRFLLERLVETTEAMAERLEGTGDDGKPKVFRDTLVSNARKAAEAALKLNVTGDEKLKEAANQLYEVVQNIEANELRPSHKEFSKGSHESALKTAKDVKSKASEMLAGLG